MDLQQPESIFESVIWPENAGHESIHGRINRYDKARNLRGWQAKFLSNFCRGHILGYAVVWFDLAESSAIGTRVITQCDRVR